MARKTKTPRYVATGADGTPSADASAPRRHSKIAEVIALLERTEGATLAEMTDATGWQPHSARAALTGLKKKGHAIGKSKRDDVTCYFITAPA